MPETDPETVQPADRRGLERTAAYYRDQADRRHHDLGMLSETERGTPGVVDRLTRERDQWAALATELERYLAAGLEAPAWDTGEGDRTLW